MSSAALMEKPADPLLWDLSEGQSRAVRCGARRLLLLGQPGCGGTEALLRRVASWVGREGVPPSEVAVIARSQGASRRLRSRLRRHLPDAKERQLPAAGERQLPDAGEIHVGPLSQIAFELLRDLSPRSHGEHVLIGEGALFALAERFYDDPLELDPVRDLWRLNHHHAIRDFLGAHRLLQQLDLFEVGAGVGREPLAEAFALSSGRLHRLLGERRLLDPSTAEWEAVRLLRGAPKLLKAAQRRLTHIAIDGVEELTPLQHTLISLLVGERGRLLALGDPCQAIGRGRSGRVELLRRLRGELEGDAGGEVIELNESVRSTPRLLRLDNEWAETFGDRGEPGASPIVHAGVGGRAEREDAHPSHLAAVRSWESEQDARWVAETIASLLTPQAGAKHDLPAGVSRPIGYQDVAIVLRSWATARTFVEALASEGIPALFEGFECFAQPEAIALVAALMHAAGYESLPGSYGELSFHGHAVKTLRCGPEPSLAVRAACERMREDGLPLRRDAARTLLRDAERLRKQAEADRWPDGLTLSGVYLQLLRRLGADQWDGGSQKEAIASHHLRALQSIVQAVELPLTEGGGGASSDPAADFSSQAFTLAAWAPRGTEDFEADLSSAPPAVRIITPGRARGRAFAATFVVDLRAHVLPSKVARKPERLPFDGKILQAIDPGAFADNEALDGERSVLHIALTRSERYLFLTSSGRNKSSFWKWIEVAVPEAGGIAGGPEDVKVEAELMRREGD